MSKEGASLGLNFYNGDRTQKIAFEQVLKYLVEHGAEFTGRGWAYLGADATQKRFCYQHALPAEEIYIGERNLNTVLQNETVQVLSIDMYGAIGLTQPGVSETVAYDDFWSDEAVEVDQHPIVILTDGNVFSYPSGLINQEEAYKAGKLIYERFAAIVKATRPSYASITVEYDMRCPTDLRLMSAGGEFTNFFISQTFVGDASISTIQALYEGTYIEKLDDGIYVSCYEYMNPNGLSLDYNRVPQDAVAKIVVSASIR